MKYFHWPGILLILAIIFLYREYIGYVLFGTLAIGFLILLGMLVFSFLYYSEKYKLIRAERRTQEKEADVFHIINGNQILIRDLNHNATWRNATIDPRIYANGKLTEPVPLETRNWDVLNIKQGKAKTLPALTQLPNKIDLLDLLETGTLRNLILGLRVDDYGEEKVISAPILRMCHVAIGGATDSGKSNLGRVIAYQAATAPENVKLVFSDLKGTSFKPFKLSNKLFLPVLETSAEFTEGMGRIKDEMDTRKEAFKRFPTVETLPEYNAESQRELPFILIFIDEVSNLFINQEIQTLALEILREARAFGIYVVAMGQSWSHKEMNTSIRDQFRTRFHFGTNDGASSRILLGDSSATQIINQGRAFVSLPFGMSKGVVEIQTPYLDNQMVIEQLSKFDNASKPELIKKLDGIGLKKNKISDLVYGSPGGEQYSLIRKALGEI